MLNIPAHPTHNFKCELCKHWLSNEKRSVVVLPNGQALDIKSALASGQGVPDGPRSHLAACTRYPKWEIMLSEQWCGSFESKPLPQ